MATVMQIAEQLVSLCQSGQYGEAIDTLYSPQIESIEAVQMPGHPIRMKGIDAAREKLQTFLNDNEVHGGEVIGPYPHCDNRFAVYFKFDITPRQTGQRMTMDEIGIYTVEDDKIVKEEFFYQMPG